MSSCDEDDHSNYTTAMMDWRFGQGPSQLLRMKNNPDSPDCETVLDIDAIARTVVLYFSAFPEARP